MESNDGLYSNADVVDTVLVDKVRVTPELAGKWLRERNGNIGQRKLSPFVVENYSRIINAGLWDNDVHQGIAFGTDGQILDGQHRLAAIARCGKAVDVLVFTGLNSRSMAVIDTGKTRTSADGLKSLGMEMSTKEASICREFVYRAYVVCSGRKQGSGSPKVMAHDLLQCWEVFHEPIQFSCEALSNTARFGNRLVRFAVAKAWYHVPHEDLLMFCRVLHDGLPQRTASEDMAAVSFRNWMLRVPGGGDIRGKMHEGRCFELTLRAEYAISKFIAKTASKCIDPGRELYDVPVELLKRLPFVGG